MAKKAFKNFKEIFGMGGNDDYTEESVEDTGIIDVSVEEENNKPTKGFFTKLGGNNKEEAKESQDTTTDTSGYQSIIIKPRRFEDCKKIATYIKENKTVTLNLEYLDNEMAQRIIDFLSGAMSIKEAKFIEISKSVYVSVPKNINVFFDGKEEKKEKSFLNF